jgi:hypothetical protein
MSLYGKQLIVSSSIAGLFVLFVSATIVLWLTANYWFMLDFDWTGSSTGGYNWVTHESWPYKPHVLLRYISNSATYHICLILLILLTSHT